MQRFALGTQLFEIGLQPRRLIHRLLLRCTQRFEFTGLLLTDRPGFGRTGLGRRQRRTHRVDLALQRFRALLQCRTILFTVGTLRVQAIDLLLQRVALRTQGVGLFNRRRQAVFELGLRRLFAVATGLLFGKLAAQFLDIELRLLQLHVQRRHFLLELAAFAVVLLALLFT